MQFKVLVTDFEYKSLENERKVFEKEGIKFLEAQCKTEEEVIEAAKDVDGLLVQYAPITSKVLESLPKLKAVARYGVGVDAIDVKAATRLGVKVLNVASYCEDEVSDHAMALILASARKIPLLSENVKYGEWNFNVAKPIYRLSGKKLGIIAFGKIARKLAEKAKAFGLDIIVYDPNSTKDLETKYGAKFVSYEEIFKESDFVSVHVPLNENTKHMITEKEFRSMKPSAFIINTARGAVIDECALINSLRFGEIAGAALDVTEIEPIDLNSPLLKMDNVIITPHAGWYSEESQKELQRKAAEGVADVLMGRDPKYLVNK